MEKKNLQSGQVLLIVVLVLIIALTVGLSAVSRSITNSRLSEEEVSSRRALFAAEAGIEKALSSSFPAIGTFTGILSDNGASYSTTVTAISGVNLLMLGGNPIPKDEGATLWLSNYSDDSAKIYNNSWGAGSIGFFWGDSTGECNNSALELMLVEGPKSAPKITRSVYDPCGLRRTQNHLSSPAVIQQGSCACSGLPDGVIRGTKFAYYAAVSVSSPLMIRVVPLYKDAVVGAVGGNNDKALSIQGFESISLGKSGTTKINIKATKEYPQLPAGFFSHSLFSP